MKETCYACGHSWGVTMEPREKVLCSSCARPQPWQQPWYAPDYYWSSRIWTLEWPPITESPEWWDTKATLADLRVAKHCAATLAASTEAVAS